MTHYPDTTLDLNTILKSYYVQIKSVPSMRFGQFFMNIAYSSVVDSVLFYETDIDKALKRIYELYANPDGSLRELKWNPK